MENTIVLSGLKRKRAEIAGELDVAERLVERLRLNLGAIDRAIRIFDPNAAPERIKSKRPARKPAFMAAGQFTRSLLDVLRRAGEPMTARQIADAMVEQHKLEAAPGAGMNRLTKMIRAALVRKGAAHEKRGDAVFWRVAGSE